MRQNRLVKRITPWRTLYSIAAVIVVAFGAALSSSDAQGRVDPSAQQPTGTALSPDAVGLVTGGGTVTVTAATNFVASFGLNAKRPAGFTSGGTAVGRISYDRHTQMASRHVNVPVTLMSLELAANPSPNGTGGRAQIVGDCDATGAECPAGFSAVLVQVTDGSDTGTGDVFNISFCTGAATSNPPAQCGPAEGGTEIRTGQIQIRASASGGSAQVPTHASAPRLKP
jgi:hypothetical protein